MSLFSLPHPASQPTSLSFPFRSLTLFPFSLRKTTLRFSRSLSLDACSNLFNSNPFCFLQRCLISLSLLLRLDHKSGDHESGNSGREIASPEVGSRTIRHPFFSCICTCNPLGIVSTRTPAGRKSFPPVPV